MSSLPSSGRNADFERALQDAFQRTASFQLTKISGLTLSQKQASELAEQEAAFHTIAIDDHGMSSGMRLNLLQPVRAVATEWRQLRSDFETALQPKMADIQAVGQLQAEAQAEVAQRDEELQAVENELRQSSKYDQIDDHKRRSQDLYESFLNKHGNRNAVMFANSWFYWVLISLVLVTECFINYHAFNEFWGVPAVAFGTTAVLGVLLALAAHGHGETLKQWSFRFGPARDPAMRWTDWRMLGMSTAALAIVLGFTGWARWAAAISTLGSQNQESALGNLGMVAVSPGRDVMISLIANLGAWMVGVIISYLSHDPDPDYMAATKQFRAARSDWNKARAKQEVRCKYIVARHANVIQEKTTAAQTREKNVVREIDMLKQVKNRGEAVQNELEAVTTGNVELYRDALVRIALSRQGSVQIVRGDSNTPFSPFDYKAMHIASGQIMAQVAA